MPEVSLESPAIAQRDVVDKQCGKKKSRINAVEDEGQPSNTDYIYQTGAATVIGEASCNKEVKIIHLLGVVLT